MINVYFPEGIDEKTVPAVTQWDCNRTILLSGLGTTDGVLQVHFFNRFSYKAIIRIAYKQTGSDKYEVSIPNRLLEEHHDIYACVYLTNYEAAAVNAGTTGTYYTRTGSAANGYAYTKVTLPPVVSGTTYYKATGETIKKIHIPVIRRARPDEPLDRDDPTDEEIIEELLRYCNNLNASVNYYTNELNKYVSKKLVQLVSKDEYDAMVEAGTMESGVIYCLKEQDTLDIIAEEIADDISARIDGTHPDGKTLAVTYVENAGTALNANNADQADYAHNAAKTQGTLKVAKSATEYVEFNGSKEAVIGTTENPVYFAANAERAARADYVGSTAIQANSDGEIPIGMDGTYVVFLKTSYETGDIYNTDIIRVNAGVISQSVLGAIRYDPTTGNLVLRDTGTEYSLVYALIFTW